METSWGFGDLTMGMFIYIRAILVGASQKHNTKTTFRKKNKTMAI